MSDLTTYLTTQLTPGTRVYLPHEVEAARAADKCRIEELCDRLDALADDKMRLDKLPQCFHMLRTEPGAPGKDQQWWLTYAPNQKYGSAREAIDAYTAPGEKP